MSPIVAFFHALNRDVALCYAFGIVYSVASSFAMVSSSVLMSRCQHDHFRLPSHFFIFPSAAHTSHAVIGGTSSGSVCIVTAWSLSYNSKYNYFCCAI